MEQMFSVLVDSVETPLQQMAARPMAPGSKLMDGELPPLLQDGDHIKQTEIFANETSSKQVKTSLPYPQPGL
jgi:hypothetical protein